MATVTPALVQSAVRGYYRPRVLRTALYAWASEWSAKTTARSSRVRKRRHRPEVAHALAWVTKHPLPITEAAKPEHLRKALTSISAKLDGKAAAGRDHLETNPLERVDWQAPPTDDEIDFRFAPDPQLARSLITAVRAQGTRGEHLEASFSCIYYAAMRPGEIAALKSTDCVLPTHEDKWGELILAESQPEVAAGWTDDGASYDKRGLNRRASKTTRPVPIPPVLVRMLHRHEDRYGLAPDGRLFHTSCGGDSGDKSMLKLDRSSVTVPRRPLVFVSVGVSR
ncbi:hypothetical protein [Streptomyces sp. NPDC058155]|uniref:hypothetical protein n=1 Tax=Streptomyces sp. NPDC058155 TaxID=3346359 RepID=UPI0036E82F85